MEVSLSLVRDRGGLFLRQVGEPILVVEMWGDKLHDKMGQPWTFLSCLFAQLFFSLDKHLPQELIIDTHWSSPDYQDNSFPTEQ